MAILKAIGNTGKSKSSLRNIINYVGKKAEVTQGILCSNDYEKIYEQFNQTKDFYGKNEGRQYKHYVISFDDFITYSELIYDKHGSPHTTFIFVRSIKYRLISDKYNSVVSATVL